MRDPFFIDEPTVISFSGGRTSAYMLYRILQANNGVPTNSFVCFANTGKENEETLKFVEECATQWQIKIHWLEYCKDEPRFKEVTFETASRAGEPFEQLIFKRRYLPNPVARFCTAELKILTIDRFMKSLGIDEYLTAIGIRADEMRRAAKMTDKFTPLIAAGITQKDIQDFWNRNDFNLKLPFNNGITPLGNCDLCFLKGGNQIVSLIADKPQRAIWWADMEEKIGGTWRSDRPAYKEMLNFVDKQQDMFSDETIDCFCGD